MRKNPLLAVAVLTAATLAVHAEVEPYGVLPTAPHLAYHEREIIAIVHWGPNTFTGAEWGFGNVPAEKVNPDRLDPEQWVTAMKAAEIRAVVLVAKHHDGFCLWPSKLCPDGYSLANASGMAKGLDLVKAVSDACRKHGLKFGCYLSPWDRHQANYGTPAYVDYFHAQWRELFTNYGEICEIWLDGANGGTGWYGGANGGKGERRSIPAGYYRRPQLLMMMHNLQPNALAFNGGGNWSTTWCGTEAGRSPETWRNVRTGEDGKKYWSPAECDTPFRRGWFFHANERPKSLARLVKTYFESVGHGAVLNFGIAPDTHGRICDDDVARLKEFGDWVREFNRTDFASGAVRTESGPAASRVITLKMPRPVRFNCCDIREEIRLGQRVEGFVFEAKVNGAWHALARGTTIGSRRLGRFEPVVADEVRVTLKAAAEPVISTFALRFARSVGTSAAAADDALSRLGWKPFAASVGDTGAVRAVIDGNWKTIWNTHLRSGPFAPPQFFAIDCGAPVTMKGFDYVPRQGRCQRGMIDQYEFHTSEDGKTWTLRACGEFGNIQANPVRQRVAFEAPVTARYFRFTGTHAINGDNHCSVAEIYLY